MTEVEIMPGVTSPKGIGTIPLLELTKFSGRQILQRLIDGHYPAPPISQIMKFTMTEFGEGTATFEGLPGADHLNPLGGVHGGWMATIMDSAMVCAVMSRCDQGEGYATIEFKVNLTRPVTTRTGLVKCHAQVVHKGRTTAVCEARLTDQSDKLLAFSTETCAIFSLEQLMGKV